MALLTLLPFGVIQLSAAIDHGYSHARSAELMQKPIIQLLVWLRVPGRHDLQRRRIGIGWLVAFAPWVLRFRWIYLSPRADGAIG